MKITSRPSAFLTWTLLAVLAMVPAADAQSALSFAKSFNPATIGPGSVSTLRFVITNNSTTAAGNVAFTDVLPAGVTIASPAKTSSTCGGLLSAPPGGGTITFSGGKIGPARSCVIRVDVTSATPGTHTNTSGTLTSDLGSHGTATATLTVATDRPGFTKSFAPGVVQLGGRSTLTFTIDNSANTGTAFNLAFTDPLPPGMVVASPTNASKTCSGGQFSPAAGASVISYEPFSGPTISSVAAGATCTLRVDVLGQAVPELGNTSGELTSSDTLFGTARSSGKAAATLLVTVEPIFLAKAFTDDPAVPGGTATLQFSVRNLDRIASATGIAFTDDLDVALSGLVATGPLPTNPCGAGSTLTGTSVLTLADGMLGPEGNCTFSVTVAVPAGAAAGAYSNTTSAVTADVGGNPVTGNAATDTLFVDPVPLLTKTFTGDPVGGGGSLGLDFSITNTSPSSTATDIVFTDEFAVVLPTASSVPADGFCGTDSAAVFTPSTTGTGSGGSPASLVVSGVELGAGETCTFSLTLDVAAGAAAGIYDNTTSEITATIDGKTVSGPPASDDFAVVAAPTLRKSFTDDPVGPGDTVTLRFTLSYDEDGNGDVDLPGEATDIGFTDDLEAALSGLVATGLPLADPCGAGSELTGTSLLTLTGGSLAPDEACTFDVTLQVPATAPAGSHLNSTSNVVATVLGTSTAGPGASDRLKIAGLELAKEFTDDPVLAGGTVNLRFTIDNLSSSAAATGIQFTDDLDAVLSGLAATGLPLVDPCGAGSELAGSAGDTFLTLTGGNVAAGTSCTFDVTLQVPAGALSDTYVNATSGFSGVIDGVTVDFDNASDELVVSSDFLSIDKEFTDDPAAPGGNVNLRFTLLNLSPTEAISDIAFTDDLDAALSGLASVSGTLTDVCGVGSEISGTGLLTFTGGSLAAGASCSFDVTLAVPSGAALGTFATNTTSEVTGTSGGLPVVGEPASDVLAIDFLAFSKEFQGSGFPGGTVVLTFTIQNLSATDAVEDLGFADDLDAVLAGLVALGLPAADVCGLGSQLSGTALIQLTGGSLLPGGSCTFGVTLAVPATAAPGSYPNVTSSLLTFGGAPGASPASDTLVVVAPVDSDGDGVLDGEDLCPGTAIPEGVPTVRLGVNRYALVDGDFVFDTKQPKGEGPGDVFTTADTGGCSCEQIIAARGLGEGHVKYGCSLGAMREWVAMVSGFGFTAQDDSEGRPCPSGCDPVRRRPHEPTGAGITVSVEGRGDVTSSRPEIDGVSYLGMVCPSGKRCHVEFEPGSPVVLQARPSEADTEFAGWGGNCYGSDPITVVSAGSNTECTATFRKREE